jgi:divalent metal cation (Fe/Co/Zn/Cd) transporter
VKKLTGSNIQIGKRIALASISVSALLAIGKIIIGWWAGSTSVVADGMESAGDVLASGIGNLCRCAAYPNIVAAVRQVLTQEVQS